MTSVLSTINPLYEKNQTLTRSIYTDFNRTHRNVDNAANALADETGKCVLEFNGTDLEFNYDDTTQADMDMMTGTLALKALEVEQATSTASTADLASNEANLATVGYVNSKTSGSTPDLSTCVLKADLLDADETPTDSNTVYSAEACNSRFIKSTDIPEVPPDGTGDNTYYLNRQVTGRFNPTTTTEKTFIIYDTFYTDDSLSTPTTIADPSDATNYNNQVIAWLTKFNVVIQQDGTKSDMYANCTDDNRPYVEWQIKYHGATGDITDVTSVHRKNHSVVDAVFGQDRYKTISCDDNQFEGTSDLTEKTYIYQLNHWPDHLIELVIKVGNLQGDGQTDYSDREIDLWLNMKAQNQSEQPGTLEVKVGTKQSLEAYVTSTVGTALDTVYSKTESDALFLPAQNNPDSTAATAEFKWTPSGTTLIGRKRPAPATDATWQNTNLILDANSGDIKADSFTLDTVHINKIIPSTDTTTTAADTNVYTAAKVNTSYATINHNHDSTYLTIADAASTYATINHNHDSDYADIDHNHDTEYADINHNHDSDYASINHNHDASYAAINHTHNDYLENNRVIQENDTATTANIYSASAVDTKLSQYSTTSQCDNAYAAKTHNHDSTYVAKTDIVASTSTGTTTSDTNIYSCSKINSLIAGIDVEYVDLTNCINTSTMTEYTTINVCAAYRVGRQVTFVMQGYKSKTTIADVSSVIIFDNTLPTRLQPIARTIAACYIASGNYGFVELNGGSVSIYNQSGTTTNIYAFFTVTYIAQ